MAASLAKPNTPEKKPSVAITEMNTPSPKQTLALPKSSKTTLRPQVRSNIFEANTQRANFSVI